MSSQVDDDEIWIQPIKIPEFESTIPDDVAKKLPDRDRDVLHTLNVIAQKLDFLINDRVSQSVYHVKMEKRIRKVEKSVEILAGKWAPIFWIIALSTPVIIVKMVNKMWP